MYMGTLKNLKMESLLNAKRLRALAFCRLQVNLNRDIWVVKQEMKENQGSRSQEILSLKKKKIWDFLIFSWNLPTPLPNIFLQNFWYAVEKLSDLEHYFSYNIWIRLEGG